ncbi:MAG: IS5 family transposase [Thermomicrobiales bacterium]|nr:MAG: IS5 family transposase [Thermomicrobiales bacterium]
MDTITPTRTPYASDISDEEWAFLAPYLTLMRDDAPQRTHALREVFNGLRFIARTGLQWRMMPHDLPPWQAVYQQTRRWIEAGVFETIIADLRGLIRLGEGRLAEPSTVIVDSRTLQSTPESGGRAGWDGAKRKKGTKVHLAVDTLGQVLALHVTPANAQDRDQVAELAAAVQEATGQTVTVAYVDQGYTGERPRQAAAAQGIDLLVVKLPTAKRGFVLLPKRWVIERDFGWMSRFRRLARDQERLAEVLRGFHLVAFTMLMWSQVLPVLGVL